MAKITRKTFLRSTLLLLILIPGTGYSQNISEALKKYFSDIRYGKYPAVSDKLILPENSEKIITDLTTYLHDTLKIVRSNAVTILNLVGTKAIKPEVRRTVVKKLLEGAGDSDSGIAGLALDCLTNFRRSDFNAAAGDSLASLFKRKKRHEDKIIKLAGFVELSNLSQDIRTLTQPGNKSQTRWAAMLSLARMGDDVATNNIISRILKLPVNDQLVYEIFPDLIYTRNREVINYMIEVAMSDAKDCVTADAEHEVPMPCAYRIMEQLAPVIKDYPIKPDDSGDLESVDYAASLTTVRQWLSKNKNYVILRDHY